MKKGEKKNHERKMDRVDYCFDITGGFRRPKHPRSKNPVSFLAFLDFRRPLDPNQPLHRVSAGLACVFA